MSRPVEVLAGEVRVTNTEYSPGITTTIAAAAASLPPGTYWLVSDEARSAVSGLVQAAREVAGWEEKSLYEYSPHLSGEVEQLAAALAKFVEPTP